MGSELRVITETNKNETILAQVSAMSAIILTRLQHALVAHAELHNGLLTISDGSAVAISLQFADCKVRQIERLLLRHRHEFATVREGYISVAFIPFCLCHHGDSIALETWEAIVDECIALLRSSSATSAVIVVPSSHSCPSQVCILARPAATTATAQSPGTD